MDISTFVTKNSTYGLHMISHGMHGSDIYPHSGKKLSFSTCLNYFLGWDQNLANMSLINTQMDGCYGIESRRSYGGPRSGSGPSNAPIQTVSL